MASGKPQKIMGFANYLGWHNTLTLVMEINLV